MPIKFFLSHSASDSDLAAAVVALFKYSLQLKPDEIRCTSVVPYNLPSGANTDATLKAEIKKSVLVMGLLTKDSSDSYYVLAELGARWGQNKKNFMILRSSNFTFRGFSGPLANLMISSIDTDQILLKHINQARKYFGKGTNLKSNSKLQPLIDEVKRQNMILSTGLLQIHSGLWGLTGATIDITIRLTSLIQNDTLTAFVGNDLAAHDPAPNIPKTLTIDYTYNGNRVTRSWIEGVLLQIP